MRKVYANGGGLDYFALSDVTVVLGMRQSIAPICFNFQYISLLLLTKINSGTNQLINWTFLTSQTSYITRLNNLNGDGLATLLEEMTTGVQSN